VTPMAAGSAVLQGADGAVVELQAAGQLQMIGKPLFARRQRRSGGVQQGAEFVSVGEAQQCIRFAPAGDQRIRAATCGTLRGPHLGDHTALADAAARASGHGFVGGVVGAAFADQRRAESMRGSAL